jgi:hypothetical protein
MPARTMAASIIGWPTPTLALARQASIIIYRIAVAPAAADDILNRRIELCLSVEASGGIRLCGRDGRQA